MRRGAFPAASAQIWERWAKGGVCRSWRARNPRSDAAHDGALRPNLIELPYVFRFVCFVHAGVNRRPCALAEPQRLNLDSHVIPRTAAAAQRKVRCPRVCARRRARRVDCATVARGARSARVGQEVCKSDKTAKSAVEKSSATVMRMLQYCTLQNTIKRYIIVQ